MRKVLAGALLLTLVACLGACRDEELPDPSTQAYRDAVAAFYAGLASIQTGANRHAEEKLTLVTELAPGEPAAWANLGLLALRENRYEAAAERLERARSLAPDDGRIHFLLGLLEQRRGRTGEAIEYLRRAVALDPDDTRATYTFMREIERRAEAGDSAEVDRLLDRMLRTHPENLALLIDRARLAAARGDGDGLRSAVARLSERASNWPAEVQERLRALEAAASEADLRQASEQIAFLGNVLARLPSYRVNLAELQDPPGQEGTLITHFLRLPQPSVEPAEPDTALQFVADSLVIDGGPWSWVGALPLAGTRVLTLAVSNGQTVKLGTGTTLPFPGGRDPAMPSRHVIAALDYDNDYLMDLAVVGRGGFRLFRQEGAGAFVDVTGDLALPAGTREAAYTGVWTADLDLEGDLDLVLAAEGAPRVLRNNGDGTFSVWPLFGEGAGLRDFTWADIDADGDPDAVLLDAAGTVHLHGNERAGLFEPFGEVPGSGSARAVATADLDNDSRMDLLVLQSDGVLRLHSAGAEGSGWKSEVLASWTARSDSLGPASLFVADLDNNGGLDVLAATPTEAQVWLSDRQGRLQAIDASPGPRIFDVADLGGSGRLDLISLSAGGQPVHRVNQGALDYASKSIQLRAARTTGDQRINSFGIGGTVEVRAGLLYQKQRITAPVVHFGLGEQEIVDVARIIWPNGTVQAEFDLETDQTVLAQQRLKGSCPWVFTNDGREIRFVTDFLWRTALGLRINAQEGTNVMHGIDWVKIDGDALQPVDGMYDVRITAELWETHFFDHVALMVVDHPAETEVLIDERFAVPPPEWMVHTVDALRPLAEALDDEGRDVSDLVRDLDGRYLDTFELGPYQGVAQEHYVELALGDDVPRSGPLWLAASGWVRPTDSSINFAIAQGTHEPPYGLRLDVPDGKGGWKTIRTDLGFPAGKAKTILIDLEDVFRPGIPRRLRLRTNMEVYWDRLAWARGRPEAELRTHHLAPDTASLRYRGFSTVRQANHSSPELPAYDTLSATTPQWLDLIGYYTRFGDVRELIGEIDDRYVIMNAGDELVLKFPAPPPPRAGWRRDFVLIGDGWVKDGDFNTGFSKTVQPLPYHGLTDYSVPPGPLEDDPVYRRYPDDWRRYHTRYVTPVGFQRALVEAPPLSEGD